MYTQRYKVDKQTDLEKFRIKRARFKDPKTQSLREQGPGIIAAWLGTKKPSPTTDRYQDEVMGNVAASSFASSASWVSSSCKPLVWGALSTIDCPAANCMQPTVCSQLQQQTDQGFLHTTPRKHAEIGNCIRRLLM